MTTRREKQPRDYAREIAELPTRQARAEALARVPPHWQALVRETVNSAFAVRRGRSAVMPPGAGGGADDLKHAPGA